ncbi:putative cyclin-L2 [Monocercomonoides exilis]|uniref:putative cyclin-L2 n=1 Tax=Monocercomonoides exilis TaxID=2049356 RepID=UPI003559A9A8|nr:putative cyclin-L2 [Monocercomonoides exilis]|eukprot:MONOS_2767.1-p1 / transcript=MONOS_2767.1 / gene=MONOS_2767 / organism=Monocercomonoides_exilis_PA203 / gene_product=cyclin-L2 / transcript_product=cyclin-L2 / location=Mono_scaffold00059:49357-50273(-) / protein_length=246 / sequence_SO=supercontig / SO=protein_coding / is_pseudo=false
MEGNVTMMDETSKVRSVELCEEITHASILLLLPNPVTSSTLLFFHRYHERKSFSIDNAKKIASASLFLSCKIHENERHPLDIFNVLSILKSRKSTTERIIATPFSSEYISFRDSLLEAEVELVQVLGFDLRALTPHHFGIGILKQLSLIDNKKIVQTSWNLFNDSMKIDLCNRFSMLSISISCVVLAARFEKVKLPQNWWNVFGEETIVIQNICQEIMNLLQKQHRLNALTDKIDEEVCFHDIKSR